MFGRCWHIWFFIFRTIYNHPFVFGSSQIGNSSQISIIFIICNQNIGKFSISCGKIAQKLLHLMVEQEESRRLQIFMGFNRYSDNNHIYQGCSLKKRFVKLNWLAVTYFKLVCMVNKSKWTSLFGLKNCKNPLCSGHPYLYSTLNLEPANIAVNFYKVVVQLQFHEKKLHQTISFLISIHSNYCL